MRLVSKCCCCFNLKYGYFKYGILCLMGRVCALTALYFISSEILVSSSLYYFRSEGPLQQMILSATSMLVGWFLATSVALFIALKGIVQKRSVLMYPYVVIMFLEIIAVVITAAILAAVGAPWYVFFNGLIAGGIDVYALMCLISLYQYIKECESRRPKSLDNIAPTV